MTTSVRSDAEVVERFPCFGTTCTVIVAGRGPAGSADQAVRSTQRRLQSWHDQFTRFEASSELSLLNADPRPEVPAGATMRRFVSAARAASELTGGLVDATLTGAIESAGYVADLAAPNISLERALELAPARRAARPHPGAAWRDLAVDRRAGTVLRPPGVRLDSGGIAKGLFADILALLLGGHGRFVVDCGGDLRLGGTESVTRSVEVQSPFEDRVLDTLELCGGAVATSGIGRRRWLAADGSPAHHLLDPSTGRPAFTGIVQVTALAPSALRAEALAKAALLAGPTELPARLPHGGIAVLDDGSVRHI